MIHIKPEFPIAKLFVLLKTFVLKQQLCVVRRIFIFLLLFLSYVVHSLIIQDYCWLWHIEWLHLGMWVLFLHVKRRSWSLLRCSPFIFCALIFCINQRRTLVHKRALRGWFSQWWLLPINSFLNFFKFRS